MKERLFHKLWIAFIIASAFVVLACKIEACEEKVWEVALQTSRGTGKLSDPVLCLVSIKNVSNREMVFSYPIHSQYGNVVIEVVPENELGDKIKWRGVENCVASTDTDVAVRPGQAYTTLLAGNYCGNQERGNYAGIGVGTYSLNARVFFSFQDGAKVRNTECVSNIVKYHVSPRREYPNPDLLTIANHVVETQDRLISFPTTQFPTRSTMLRNHARELEVSELKSIVAWMLAISEIYECSVDEEEEIKQKAQSIFQQLDPVSRVFMRVNLANMYIAREEWRNALQIINQIPHGYQREAVRRFASQKIRELANEDGRKQ